MKKNVTMQDIGAALGVSTVTISKALAGKDGVSEAVRQKIIRTAQEMGYHYLPANTAAMQKNTVVGIIMADHFFSAGAFYAALYKEIVIQMMDRRMLGVMELISAAREREAELPSLVAEHQVTAVLAMGQLAQPYVEKLLSAQLPTVLVDFYLPGVEADAVVSDGQQGTAELTELLIRQGHRKIGFVGTINATSSVLDRYNGYLHAMMSHDLPVCPQWHIEDRDAGGLYLDPFILPAELPTAFVCENDQVAQLLIDQLQSMHLRVPEDISVTGFDNFPPPEESRHQLTTYTVDMERIAQIAVRRLASQLTYGSEGGIRTIVSGWVQQRKTVAPPREREQA